jgi:2-octaprenyl-6-methoxyphenol hydroxylase
MGVAAIDILIRGAGPVGCTLALALRDSGLRISLLDSSSSTPSFRPLALSYASRLILERLGAWEAIASTPLESVMVSQAGGFGRTRLAAADADVPALGYVTDYAALSTTLKSAARGLLTREDSPARCVVHAEGWTAQAAEKRYDQHAVLARVRTDPPARHTAFERFTPEGPLALLPLAGSYALIWSTSPARARALMAADEPEFLRELAGACGSAPGRPVGVEDRAVQPLILRVRPARVGAREVYVGNAAQTLHPVAGQGLNLGLRDAWELAEALHGAPDPGAPAILARYAARRRIDASATIRATDLLAGAFLGRGRALRAARGAALAALDLLPGPRRFFARRMIFGASALP